MDKNLKEIEVAVLVTVNNTVYTTDVAGGLVKKFPAKELANYKVKFIKLDGSTTAELAKKAVLNIANVVLGSQPDYKEALLELGKKF